MLSLANVPYRTREANRELSTVKTVAIWLTMGEEMFEFIALMSFGLNWDTLKQEFPQFWNKKTAICRK